MPRPWLEAALMLGIFITVLPQQHGRESSSGLCRSSCAFLLPAPRQHWAGAYTRCNELPKRARCSRQTTSLQGSRGVLSLHLSSDSAANSGAAPLQRGRKTLGIDYGLRRTGICVSVGFSPRPLPLIQHKNDSAVVVAEVCETIRKEVAEQVVIGMPLNTNGTEGEQANHTRTFVEKLRAASPATRIYLWDERFSSAVAKEKLAEMGYSSRDMKGMVDTVASIGILQDFFDKDGAGAEVAHEPTPEDIAAAAAARKESGGVSPVSQSPAEWRKEMQRKAAEATAAPKGKKRKR